MIAGGIVSGFGIENPRRRIEAVPTRGAAAAGECGHGADADSGDEQSQTCAQQPEQAPAVEAV